MGGYTTPYQQLSWLYYGGGLDAAQKLYTDIPQAACRLT